MENNIVHEKIKLKNKESLHKTKKSNHKHQYEDVLLRIALNSGREHYSLGKRCKICGKTAITKYFITEQRLGRTYLVLDSSKILELYQNLEIVDY